MDRSVKYEIAASVLLIVAAGTELGRIIANEPWGGFVPWVSALISALLAAVFLATTTFFFLRRRFPRLESPAWILALASPLIMLAHGVVTRTAKDPLGIIYMFAAVAVAFCVKRSYDRGEIARSVAHAESGRLARR
jgi:hypothetical protein